ncbi:MAG: DUF1294 domain-containing protein [Bacilli bacterium]|nr:DUF1294 domain-containing protein [Bacilli bacterium]
MYLIIYLGLTVFFSFVALIAYFRDKKLAVKGKERTKEKTLLFLAVFFGSVGAFLGRILAHHKTDKKYFSMVIYFSMLMQAATIAALVIFVLA